MRGRRFSFGAGTALTLSIVAFLASSGLLLAQADYVAYAVTKDGEFALPEDIDLISDENLIQMKWGEFAGPTRRVGVMPVDNTSTAGSYSFGIPGMSFDYGGGQVPVNGIEAMITDAMNQTNRFRLVERAEVGNVLAEQNLAADGRTTSESGARTGQILGAEYLVQAVITSYEPDFQGKKGGASALMSAVGGGFGRKKSQSMVGMNFRLVDAETSEIVFTKQIDVVVSSVAWNFNAGAFGGAAFGGFMESYANTPIGQAVMAGVNQGVYELVKQIGTQPMEGSVIQVRGDQIYVNLGSDVVENGEILNAIKPGEELIDPDTGLSLGGVATTLGQVQLTQVSEKFSIGKAMDFDASRLSRGDPVVSTKAPPDLRFASSWAGPLSKEQKKKKKG